MLISKESGVESSISKRKGGHGGKKKIMGEVTVKTQQESLVSFLISSFQVPLMNILLFCLSSSSHEHSLLSSSRILSKKVGREKGVKIRKKFF